MESRGKHNMVKLALDACATKENSNTGNHDSVMENITLGGEDFVHRLLPKSNASMHCPVVLEEDIKFLLYTRYMLEDNFNLQIYEPLRMTVVYNSERAHRLHVDWDISLHNSNMNSRYPTVVYVHGFSEYSGDISGQTIKDAYLRRGFYNVILVDWSPLAALPYYSVAVKNTDIVGNYLATFLEYLNSRGIPLSNVHVIGFSLGAEIAGFTGQNLRIGNMPRLPRITGLDPAYPLFAFRNSDFRLSREDAIFVDVIHTNPGVLGFPTPVGHADFFPNGATAMQPGCSDMTPGHSESLPFCSHQRSWMYYVESLYNEFGFYAIRCNDWNEFLSGMCSSRNGFGYMGIAAHYSLRGKFYLQTNEHPPFAQGIGNYIEERK